MVRQTVVILLRYSTGSGRELEMRQRVRDDVAAESYILLLHLFLFKARATQQRNSALALDS